MPRLFFRSKEDLDEWYKDKVRVYDAKRAIDRESFVRDLDAKYVRYMRLVQQSGGDAEEPVL